jgi:MFS transporter, DHA1 family, solute carrier family 18 (vesicular amine transporter), member 1/2
MPKNQTPWLPVAVVAFALFVDYAVYGMVLPLTPMSSAGISSDEQLSILAGGYGVGLLIATPFFGIYGDRIGFRRPMVLGALLLAAATVAFALAPNLPVMLAGRILQGFAAAASWTAGLALVGSQYSGGTRVRLMGYVLMGSTGGSVLGPVLGGWLHSLGGYQLPFFVLLALIIVAAIGLFLALPRDTSVQAGEPPNLLAVVRDRSVIIPALAVVLAASAWSVLEPLVPNHVMRAGVTDLTLVGAVFTISTVVYGCAAPLVSWIVARTGTARTLVIGAIGMAIMLPIVALVRSFWLILLVVCVANIGYALLLNPTSAALGEAVEARGEHCYSLVYAVYNIAYSIGTIGVSTLVAGLLPHSNMLIVLSVVSGALLASTPFLLRSRLEATAS